MPPTANVDLPKTWEEVAIDKDIWDPGLTHEFRNVTLSTPDESEWYGPWDTLLHMIFTHQDGFQIALSHLTSTSRSRSELEWTVFYIIKRENTPVFFVGVKPYTHLRLKNTRGRADDQMRERFNEYHELLAIPTLYGLSCMGPMFAVFELDTKSGDILPKNIKHNENCIMDYAPTQRWQFNVLTKEGEAELKQIVEEVKGMVAQLW